MYVCMHVHLYLNPRSNFQGIRISLSVPSLSGAPGPSELRAFRLCAYQALLKNNIVGSVFTKRF